MSACMSSVKSLLMAFFYRNFVRIWLLVDEFLVDLGGDNDLIIIVSDNIGIASHDFIDGPCVVGAIEGNIQMIAMMVITMIMKIRA